MSDTNTTTTTDRLVCTNTHIVANTHYVAASPRKLRTGEWGVSIQTDEYAAGTLIATEVTTRAGKTWEQITEVVWVGDGFALGRRSEEYMAPASTRPARVETRNVRCTSRNDCDCPVCF